MEFGQQFPKRAGFFYIPWSWDMGQIILPPPEGRHAVDFSNRKNPTASVETEPAVLGTRGQHANQPLRASTFEYV
jgi:hypothetical protein